MQLCSFPALVWPHRRSVASATLRVLNVGIVIASLVAFGWIAAGAVGDWDGLTPVRWLPLLAACSLQLALLFLLMVVWERLLALLWPSGSAGQLPSRWRLYTAYSGSWLARYIPGRVWSLGSRAALVNKLGVPVDLVTRSVVIEVIFTYALVTILSAALWLGVNRPFSGSRAWLVTGLAVVAALGLVRLSARWRRAAPTSRWGRPLQRLVRLALGGSRPTFSTVLRGLLVYGLYAGLQLGFIVLVAAAFAELSVAQAALIAGVWGISLTLGWLSFLTPVGLGVRDGLALAMFATLLDPTVAALVVTAARLVTLGADLVFVGLVQGMSLGLAAAPADAASTGSGAEAG